MPRTPDYPADCSSPELLRLCGSRLDDLDLWNEFQVRFQRRIFLYLLRSCRVSRGGQRELGDVLLDLAQEVYVRLVQNDGRILKSFRGEDDFAVRAFLARVAASVVADHFRHGEAEKRKANVIPIDNARQMVEQAVGPSNETDRSGDVLSLIDVERVLTREDQARNAARNALIFKLHYVDGFTAGEIAAFPGFGLSVRGVESVLWQLRRRLRGS
jgi:DNA-directed RNA polymerase specialized sigma24 family protein